MTIAQINYGCDRDLTDPDALLGRYATLTGWSDALSQAGACVTVVQRFHRRATLWRHGVKYVFTPSPNTEMLITRPAPDLAHVNGVNFFGQCWWLRRALPKTAAIVVQDHGSVPDAGASGAHAALRRTLKRTGLGAADALLFAAAAQADPWRHVLAPGHRIYDVLPASTWFRPVSRPAARERSGVHGSPAVLWVGRLNANKDPHTVLNGFERALPQMPNARLTMVYGSNQGPAGVVARIRSSAALQDRVRLVGGVPHQDLPAFFSAADLFVVGSHREGSGYSRIEACACGATPVVTDIPSFRAITGNGVVGALWRPGGAGGFAQALASAWARHSDASRTAVVRHFDCALRWPVVGRRAMAIYRDVVERRQGRRTCAVAS